jgi:uncharacterized protein (TIGR02284 family)
MAANDALKALHTAILDASEGYREAIRDATDPATAVLFREMIALRQRHHLELHEALAAQGEQPDDSGSFMATIHRTVIGVRSAVVGLDDHSLPSFVSGEEMIIDQYDRAIEESIAKPSVTALLVRQQEELLGQIEVMKTRASK